MIIVAGGIILAMFVLAIIGVMMEDVDLAERERERQRFFKWRDEQIERRKKGGQ